MLTNNSLTMKIKQIAIISLGLIISSCTDGKTADDIEKEYSGNSSSTHETSDHKNDDQPTVEVTIDTSEAEQADLSGYEYLEDFGEITSKTELYKTFGAENLMDGVSGYAEGEVELQNTTLVDPNTLNKYVYVWSDEDNETLSFIEGPGFIWDPNYEVGRRQVILSKSGVFTGMSIKELLAWNDGKDFTFSGFGWDYEGGIFAEKGSKISDAGVIIKLTLDDNTGTFNNLLGDTELSTADEDVLNAPIVVDLLTYSPSIKL